MSALPYQLTVDTFAPDHFRVHALTGKETISEAWCFRRAFVVSNGGTLVGLSVQPGECAFAHSNAPRG